MIRHAHKSTGRVRLPLCDTCGKATYSSEFKAGRDLDRFNLARIYRCEGGKVHLTSHEELPKTSPRHHEQVSPDQRHARRSVSTACPRQPDHDHDGSACLHPLHWHDLDPSRPYFPDVEVDPTQYASDPLFVMGAVAAALTRAGASRPLVNVFRWEYRHTAPENVSHVVARWVTVS